MADCIRPGKFNDDDLLAYVAGERPGRLRQHLAECRRCADLAAQFAADEVRLSRALFRLDCPTAMELGEYQLGLLTASVSRQVAAHLLRCPHCAAELNTAIGFLDDPTPGRSEPARPRPEALTTRARRAARRALDRVIAELVPLPLTPAAAFRGAPRSVTLRYAADDLTMTLHPQPADRPRGQRQLLGFLEQRDADLASLAGVPARLVGADGTVVASAVVDEIGNVILGPAPPGTYSLEVTLPTRIVVVPDLAL